MNSTSQIPLISFVIMTCNYPIEYLLECIKSITQLSLNSKEREIILIDEGSEENPIINLGKENNIIYLRLPNMGEGMAHNYGMLIAKGQYIQFIEGEDYLIQATYEHCLDIVRYHQPDIVTFNFSKDNIATEPSYELPTPVNGTDFLSNHTIQSSACSYIFRKNIVGSLVFSSNITFGVDEEFTPKLFLRAEKIFNTNTTPYYNRVEKDKSNLILDNENIDLRMNDKLEVILNLQKLLDTIPVSERQAINRRIAQLTMDYLCDNIRLKHSIIALNHEIKQLKVHGLYPLPDKEYSKRYIIFRKMIKSHLGRLALFFFIKKS